MAAIDDLMISLMIRSGTRDIPFWYTCQNSVVEAKLTCQGRRGLRQYSRDPPGLYIIVLVASTVVLRIII